MKEKFFRRFLWFLLFLFLIANIIAFMHAYKFTHFSNSSIERTSNHLSGFEKLKIAFTGVNNPRPKNKEQPNCPFTTIRIKSNKELECWMIKKDSAKEPLLFFMDMPGRNLQCLIRQANF